MLDEEITENALTVWVLLVLPVLPAIAVLVNVVVRVGPSANHA